MSRLVNLPAFLSAAVVLVSLAIDPLDAAEPRSEVYKTIAGVQLKMNIYAPAEHQAGDRRPAVVFFFGGGWRSGSPSQFDKHCQYLASRGMVAMTADYRVSSRHPVKVTDCVSDARSAIRWVRANAERLGVDPNRIAAGGGSAGGHLAAATATIEAFDTDGEDPAISAAPNALLLFNPALDLRPKAFKSDPSSERAQQLAERLGADAAALSPTARVKAGAPPAIVFHGKADTTVPFAQAEDFARAMREAGNRCDVAGYPDAAHGFFNFNRGGGAAYRDTMVKADRFLVSLGYLSGEPTIDQPADAK